MNLFIYIFNYVVFNDLFIYFNIYFEQFGSVCQEALRPRGAVCGRAPRARALTCSAPPFTAVLPGYSAERASNPHAPRPFKGGSGFLLNAASLEFRVCPGFSAHPRSSTTAGVTRAFTRIIPFERTFLAQTPGAFVLMQMMRPVNARRGERRVRRSR